MRKLITIDASTYDESTGVKFINTIQVPLEARVRFTLGGLPYDITLETLTRLVEERGLGVQHELRRDQ